MPTIAGVLHTLNDELRLGRALETLWACSDILIIDHGSTDSTLRIAREYGARVVVRDDGDLCGDLNSLKADWLLCLTPRESVTEALDGSLYELCAGVTVPTVPTFGVLVREETGEGWVDLRDPELRLVPKDWRHWNGCLPTSAPDRRTETITLEGLLLRFSFP